MKEYMEITQEQGHWSIKLSVQYITGQLFRQMQKLTSRCVTNVNALAISIDSHQSILPRRWPCGLLHNGD